MAISFPEGIGLDLPKKKKKEIVFPEGMLPSEKKAQPKATLEKAALPAEEKAKPKIVFPSEKGVDKEVVNNLPDTLQFAFWDTQIPISEEVSAGLVGAGDMMLDTFFGVKQLLGIDEDTMAREQAYIDDLYESSVGGYVMAGAVVGALAEPLGFIIPVAKAGTVLKTAAKGAAIGATYAGLGYVNEAQDQTRLGNIAIGTVAGGVLAGTIRKIGKGFETKKIARAHETIGNIERRWAEKIVEGIEPTEIRKQLQKEMPVAIDFLSQATKMTEKKLKLAMSKDEAIEVVKHYASTTKQNSVAKWADEMFGAISTRLRNLSEPVLGRVRVHDYNVMQKTHNLLEESHPFLKIVSKIKRNQRGDFDSALLSGDVSAVRRILRESGGGDDAIRAYDKVSKLLNGLGDELTLSGRISGKLQNYFPRYVKDKEGLFAALGKKDLSRAEQALNEARKKIGKLSALQESDIINKAIRGYPVTEGKPGFAKHRGVQKVTKELLPFYATPEESLHTYIRNSVTDLEKARFFGRDVKYKNVGGVREFDVDDSVGSLVFREMKNGNIDSTQYGELEHILGIRFGIGEKSPGAVIQNMKNVMYSSLLGNPVSAATQLGDTGVAIYVNGFKNTLKSLPRALIGKSKISAVDLGLVDNMAEEFATTTSTARWLRNFFKYSGFKSVDKLGKETLLNGALFKYQKFAKSPKGINKISKKYSKIFGKEFDGLVDDLKNDRVTENVKVLLFNELADVQPISLSEVPENYLASPNGRIFYMLKTFMLKQMDVLRRDAYQEIKSGSKAKGLANLMKYGIVVGSANTGSQYVKDFMLGKDIEPDMPGDIGENFLKTFGWSEYMMNKFKDKKPVEATMAIVAPPFQMFDKIMQGDAKALQYMPLGGRLWYNWFGGGLEEFEQKERQRKLTKRLER